jgi:hypothetical protein
MCLRPQVRSHRCYLERVLITSREHFFKHIKPFKCSVLNCKHMKQGFATAIDLVRHKYTIHEEGTYRCVSKSCRNNTKTWPTLHDYRLHLVQMHMSEDHVELIRKYDEKTHILEASQLTMYRSKLPHCDEVAALITYTLDVDVEMVDM